MNKKSKEGKALTGIGRPGGFGGNKVVGTGGSKNPTRKARPGGKGGQKVPSSGGSAKTPRPGGAQPAG